MIPQGIQIRGLVKAICLLAVGTKKRSEPFNSELVRYVINLLKLLIVKIEFFSKVSLYRADRSVAQPRPLKFDFLHQSYEKYGEYESLQC